MYKFGEKNIFYLICMDFASDVRQCMLITESNQWVLISVSIIIRITKPHNLRRWIVASPPKLQALLVLHGLAYNLLVASNELVQLVVNT